jgi:hypothetical protein
MGFSVVLGTDTFEEAELIKTRHEGKELLKALKNLNIEYDKLKSLSITDAEYIRECNFYRQPRRSISMVNPFVTTPKSQRGEFDQTRSLQLGAQ